jgi:glycerol-3-phosphate acyltransferase PlsY
VAAGCATVVGHNWSLFLRGAGGRGISPAMGALLVTAPVGTAVMLSGLAVGRLAGETAAGCAVADAALVPVTARVSGRRGGLAAAAVVVPIVVKRLAGNAPPQRRDVATYAARLLLDRDTWRKTAGG